MFPQIDYLGYVLVLTSALLWPQFIPFFPGRQFAAPSRFTGARASIFGKKSSGKVSTLSLLGFWVSTLSLLCSLTCLCGEGERYSTNVCTVNAGVDLFTTPLSCM
jgi:hypothetical protein